MGKSDQACSAGKVANRLGFANSDDRMIKISRFLIFLMLLCTLPYDLSAHDKNSPETLAAKSPSLEDVKGALSNARPGDTIIVPAGRATWSDQIIITKGVKLIGAGIGMTIITSGYAAPTPYDHTGYLIAYVPSSPSSNEPFRLSGFTFDLADKCQWLTIENDATTPINRIRVDHNEVSHSSGRMITIRGTVYGVIDNNRMTGGLMLTAYGLNEVSWDNLTFNFGTPDNMYFEDNICTIDDTPHDGGEGGRYCARYNTYIYTDSHTLFPWFDMHGNMGSGGNLAGMGVEIYENTLKGVGYAVAILALRGGKGLCYNNNAIVTAWANLFVREEYDDSLNPPAVAPKSGQPQHVSGSYFWGNKLRGTVFYTENPAVSGTLNYGGDIGVVPTEDKHFWREKSPFDGSTGLGVGLLANRPATGVPGVGFWATDTRKLYRWTAAHGWQEFYIPYPYPHPLRNVL
jgi:hypothetical protein